MRKGILISAIVIILVVVGALMFSLFGLRDREEISDRNGESIKIVEPSGQNEDETGEIEELPSEPEDSEGREHTIRITSSGFLPQEIEINAGDSVVFINEDSSKHWPASAVHPTHRVYPGSDISKCGTASESEIFDACRGLESGERYTFTFNEKGNWRYHDHLRASLTGTINVN